MIKEIKTSGGEHHFVGYISDPPNNLEGFVAIHRARLHYPSLGATRMSSYESLKSALHDALRLSKLMTYKSAAAELPYGGAKAVIIQDESSNRKKLLLSYAHHINSLKGRFLTGSDVGLTDSDVQFLGRHTKFVIGKHIDASKYTVLGLSHALEEALKKVFGDESFSGRTFAIQGLGKIGMNMLEIVSPQAKEVYVSETSPERIQEAKRICPKIKLVSEGNIHAQNVDVFSPCALSNSITKENAHQIHAPIVLGGANNQLESEEVANTLHKRGILYTPDYVVNAGGLISVAAEYEGASDDEEKVKHRVGRIRKTLQEILEESSKKNIPPVYVANRRAEKALGEYV